VIALMTPDQAAWVRDNAWTPRMRRQAWRVPGGGASYDAALAAQVCDCMAGVCSMCRAGCHKNCDRKTRPQPEWWIQNRPLDYIHPTAVWLADRACRSLCPCSCPPAKPRRVVEQLDLFAEVAA